MTDTDWERVVLLYEALSRLAPSPVVELQTARATVEALVDQRLPDDWDDTEAVLIGTGRRDVPVEAAALADRLPALG